MVVNMRDHPLHGMEIWQGMDPRLVEPLCIRENRLHGDPVPPDSPSSMVAKTIYDARLLSSPTSITDVVNSLPVGTYEQQDAKSSKKKKKSKSKLFRKRRKNGKDKEEKYDIARREALKREALILKHIREEEDADFAKLRAEEETSPKLDMLTHYPLTLMEEVLSIPIPQPVDCEDDDEDEYEDDTALPEGVEDPEDAVLDLGRFEEEVIALRLSQMELRRFLSHPTLFGQLQEELRDDGVITDETLRQKLHVLCRLTKDDDDIDISECRDIFSEPASRRGQGWNSNLPLAYRRMNEFSTEIDWKKEIEDDPTLFSSNTREEMKTKNKWSDRKLLNLVSNYSEKGRDSYHTQFQDDVEESDMLAYDQNLMDGVDLLTYCVHDLVPIVQEQAVFANLQQELRKIGAVTNEVLKQGLHFYVRDVRMQKEREEAAIRATEEKMSSEDVREDLRHNARTTKRQPLLTKLRLCARRNIDEGTSN